jgi:hypothetical protein
LEDVSKCAPSRGCLTRPRLRLDRADSIDGTCEPDSDGIAEPNSDGIAEPNSDGISDPHSDVDCDAEFEPDCTARTRRYASDETDASCDC